MAAGKKLQELPKIANFQDKVARKFAQYGKAFRVEDLNDANDLSTLTILIKTEVMVDDLQEQIQELMADDAIENATSIKKLADLLRDATGTITNLQRTLSIDRKTRKTEETSSVADYIRALKRDAHDFMDQRIIKVYCPECKVMVGRIYPVHTHTSFSVTFECSQCHKLIRARRAEQDVLFDVKDSSWRRKYSPEIIQPKKFNKIEPTVHDDELVLSGDPELEAAETIALDTAVLSDDIELGE